jgi:hypothetical protein
VSKLVLRSIALSTLMLPFAAFAQAPAAAPAAAAADAKPAEVKSADKVEKMIVPYGVIQTYFNLSDSIRRTDPDFTTLLVRPGLKVNAGIARAQIETDMSGNALDAKTGKGKNVIGIRRADLTWVFPSGTSFQMGRIRPGGADAWGVDATVVAPGNGGNDGLRISQKIMLPENGSVDFGVGFFNALSVITNDAAPGNIGYAMQSEALKPDKALIVNAGVEVAGVKAKVFYAAEKNAVMGLDAAAQAAASPSAVVAKTSNVNHTEASVGYSLGNLEAGVWWAGFTRSKAKFVVPAGGGKYDVVSYADEADATISKLDRKTTESVIGVGVGGDSTLFGVGDIVQTGDKFTYGLSWSMRSDRHSGLSASDEKKDDVNHIAVGAGYTVADLLLELNVANQSTENKGYANDKGEAGKETSQTQVYVTGVWGF